MQVGDLVVTMISSEIGIVRKTDFECPSQLTVFICWLQSGRVSWEDPNNLEVICK